MTKATKATKPTKASKATNASKATTATKASKASKASKATKALHDADFANQEVPFTNLPALIIEKIAAQDVALKISLRATCKELRSMIRAPKQPIKLSADTLLPKTFAKHAVEWVVKAWWNTDMRAAKFVMRNSPTLESVHAVFELLQQTACPYGVGMTDRKFEQINYTYVEALVLEGDISKIPWNHCRVGRRICKSAAKHGKLEILQWARSKGCEWDKLTLRTAAKHSQDHVLEWARANGCPEDDDDDPDTDDVEMYMDVGDDPDELHDERYKYDDDDDDDYYEMDPIYVQLNDRTYVGSDSTLWTYDDTFSNYVGRALDQERLQDVVPHVYTKNDTQQRCTVQTWLADQLDAFYGLRVGEVRGVSGVLYTPGRDQLVFRPRLYIDTSAATSSAATGPGQVSIAVPRGHADFDQAFRDMSTISDGRIDVTINLYHRRSSYEDDGDVEWIPRVVATNDTE